jgi:hypothetical protein
MMQIEKSPFSPPARFVNLRRARRPGRAHGRRSRLGRAKIRQINLCDHAT